jgi:hypothetical protein
VRAKLSAMPIVRDVWSMIVLLSTGESEVVTQAGVWAGHSSAKCGGKNWRGSLDCQLLARSLVVHE